MRGIQGCLRRGAMKKILLIDDDQTTNFINTKLIEHTGYTTEITIANTGRQGLEIIIESNQKHQPLPDLIILDINMPVMGGFEFLQALAKLEGIDTSYTKIAILSSSDHYQDKTMAIELGIQHYFTKPMEFEDIKFLLQ